MPRETETITVTNLWVATREIIENAHFRGKHYVVERAGQPMVAVIGIEEYQRLIACLELGDVGVAPPRTPRTA
jgi:hypothetical protein